MELDGRISSKMTNFAKTYLPKNNGKEQFSKIAIISQANLNYNYLPFMISLKYSRNLNDIMELY